MTFGERLRELRVARHMTQADLARLLYISPSIVISGDPHTHSDV